MGAIKDGNVHDSAFDYVEIIADAICDGSEEYDEHSDRMHTALGRIAAHLKDGGKVITGGAVTNQAASEATDVAGAVADLNALILKLKNAGVMEGDALSLTVTKSVNDQFAGHADRQYNTGKISSVAESNGVITITLSDTVANLRDFEAGNGWGTHKWLGIGISAGVSPITGLKYNGTALTSEDVAEATAVGLSAGYFVRWVAADLVLAGDETQKSKGSFTLWADGCKETKYTIKVVEG